MQALGTAGDAIKLSSASQQLAANRAISQAYSQAVDPATGQVDFEKLQALAAQNGAGAFLPQFMGQIAQQRNQQLQYDTGKLNNALTQQTNIRNTIGSLMAEPGFGKEDMSGAITQKVVDAVQSGLLPTDQAARELLSIPKDAAAQAGWVRQHFLNALSGEAKIRALLPQTQVINSGGQQNVVAVNPMTGQGLVTGTIQNTLSPEGAAANVDVIDPKTGAHYVITKQQQLNAQGGTPQGAPGMSGYTGRPAQQETPAGLPAGALPTKLGPTQESAMSAAGAEQGGQSSKAAQALHDSVADAAVRINWLEEAKHALDGLNTGPGSDWRNNAASFINSLGPNTLAKVAPGVDPNDIKNYDEFKKIMANYASLVSSGSGTGTDARLNQAITGNANPGISTLANQDIIVKTLAAEKYRQAEDYAWQNTIDKESGQPLAVVHPERFNQWQSQWNKSVSPDSFAFAAMTPEQRQSFIARKTKDGSLNAFKGELAALVRAGIIDAPGAR